MYAMLGDVRFELLQGFERLEARHGAGFARHDVLAGRPRLQAVGNELTELRIGVKLHWLLGNPDTAYKGLLAALEAQQAVSLVFGSGRFVGWFVIERLSERTLIQDAKGRTAARELDVELTEFVGDPNNPLPAPGIAQSGKNPLLSLLPESVQAQASDIMQAVEQGVQIYREAEDGIRGMQRLAGAVRELKNDPAGALNMLGEALDIGGGVLGRLNNLPQVTSLIGDLSGAAQMAAQASQAASELGGAVASARAAFEGGNPLDWLSGGAGAVERAGGALADGAAAVETLTAWLAVRRDL
ncbi:putative phage tail assembly protein [Bergeriella denitrificans]|uniref:Putative phage tail assembly protein n=1 Tax=Bergeriella denitrificans TaxID=494 RepID=A0A378UF37_BERDE|nr:phage tail protein [Bergeriella denitrificans]STZ75309.1 putative phage tail assembly protein [Bergeriella denitrificans]